MKRKLTWKTTIVVIICGSRKQIHLVESLLLEIECLKRHYRFHLESIRIENYS